jgi:hypothetical protein
LVTTTDGVAEVPPDAVVLGPVGITGGGSGSEHAPSKIASGDSKQIVPFAVLMVAMLSKGRGPNKR